MKIRKYTNFEMEKDDTETKATKLADWLSTATPEAITRFFEDAEGLGFCMNRNKLELMDSEFWKKEISETPKKFIYREPETGLFYETMDIREYLQDCRQRKRVLSTEDILDYEMVHKDNPQKLFFWISKRFEDDIERFSAALKKFLLDEFMQDTSISVDEFEDRFIIVCSNIIVENYEQKMALLKKFGSVYRTDEIGGYIAQTIGTYEEIPSIANAGYKNAISAALIANGYRPNRKIMDQIESLAVMSITVDSVNVHITNNITVNINNYNRESPFSKFVNHILSDKPDWYVSGEWIPKQVLVEKFNEFNESDISLRLLIRNLKSEDLYKKICVNEKRSRQDGKKIQLFLAR